VPYKSYADFRQWSREYQRQRRATDRQTQATAEGRIIATIQEQPGQHTELTLYALLQPAGFCIRQIERAVADLYCSRVLQWDANKRLILHDREDNPFFVWTPLAREATRVSGSVAVGRSA
jgi:hypothetical protein